MNYKFIIIFNTNALLLTEEIVLKLKEYNIKQIMVSLDSLKPDRHNKYRGKNSWEKAIRGINLLKDANISVSISTTFTSENEDEIDDFIQYCNANNFEYNPDIIFNLKNGNWQKGTWRRL